MDLYAQHILDHFRHPRGKEAMTDPTVERHELNPSCGDEVTATLKIADDAATIAWEGQGCAISQAAMSMLAEEFSGKSLKELEALTPKDILDMLGVPVGARRMKCAMLGLFTLRNALHLHAKQPPLSWAEFLANEPAA